VTARIDDQLSERTHAFGRYSYFGNGISSNTIFGKAGGTGFASPPTASAAPQLAVARVLFSAWISH